MDERRREQLQEFLTIPLLAVDTTSEEALNRYDVALTHSTYASEMRDRSRECEDNERLEFLGDRVLNFCICEHLFKETTLSEGEMTKKMGIVSNKMLAEILRKREIPIEKYMLLGKNVSPIYSIIADAFEAFIGAVYLAQGMKKVKQMLVPLFSEEIKDFEPEEENAIARLQEHVLQVYRYGNIQETLQYTVERVGGEDHTPLFKATVEIVGEQYGEGVSTSKKTARMEAARSAYKLFKKTHPR